MFESLFLNYKRTILRVDLKKDIKNMDNTTKLSFGILIMMIIFYFVCVFISLIFGNELSTEIFLGITVICLLTIALMIIHIKTLESKDEYIKRRGENAKHNMKEFVEFLVDNKVSVKDLSSIDSLICIANEKKEMTSETKSISSGMAGAFNFFVIPIITIVLKEYLSTESTIELIKRILIASVVPMVIAFVVVLLAVSLKSIFETEKQKIGYLISDLMEVKCFNEEAINMEETYKKQKSIVVTNV